MYLAARLLKIRPREWKRLPWWERELYMSGLIWELEQGGIFRPDDGGRGGGGNVQAPTPQPLTSMSDRAALGITVIE